MKARLVLALAVLVSMTAWVMAQPSPNPWFQPTYGVGGGGGGGGGDITAVGNCTSGACLSSGNTNLTGANFTDNVGIGVTNGTPARSLDLRGDSTRNAVMSTFSGTDNSKLSLVRARGTQASPTVAQSGDTLGQLFFRGQLNTTIDVFGGDTGIYGVATENMSLTNRGSLMDFYATPNGSATAALQMTLSESGAIFNEGGLAASDFRAEGDTETHLLFCDASADTCGIGNSAPNFRLSTNLTTSATNNVQSSFQLKTTSTGDMLNGFGGGMLWAIQDTAAVENNIAGISGIRDGADNSGKLVFRTFLTGSSNNRMTLLSTGELGIGDETPDAFLDVAGTLRADGQATFVADPASTGASNASVYVNPATSASNEVLLACADNGTAVFSVDKEGDMDVRAMANSASGTCFTGVTGAVCVNDIMAIAPAAGDGVLHTKAGTNTNAAGVALWNTSNTAVGTFAFFDSSTADADYADKVVTRGISKTIAAIRTDDVAAGSVVMEVRDNASATGVQLLTVDGNGNLFVNAAGTRTKGTITLAAGVGTATVASGSICVCSDTTAINAVQCSVTTTTLTANGTGTDVIAYHCL